MGRALSILPVVLPLGLLCVGSEAARGAPGLRPVVTLRRGAVTVYSAPRRRAPRRGLIGGRRVVFPLLARVKAAGCRRPWLQIAPEAFACSARLKVGRGIPKAPTHPRLRKGRSMPHSYFITRRTVTVRSKPSAKAPPVRTLREYSGVVARGKVRTPQGLWRRTRMGYLPAGATRFVRPSKLAGVKLAGTQTLPVSWVSGATAWVTSRPTTSRRARVGGLKAYTRVSVLQRTRVGRRWYVRLGPKRWVPADRVRTARARKPPPGVGASQKWIHVSLTHWTLVAYVGPRPVYAALISRGYKTPKGRFRITRKLAIATMRFATRKGVYEAEAVPWVIYFKPRYALHSAYWHDGFGSRSSHGCVNLAPTDARWLFEWTSPSLPPGWFQIRQTQKSPGTLLIIE